MNVGVATGDVQLVPLVGDAVERGQQPGGECDLSGGAGGGGERGQPSPGERGVECEVRGGGDVAVGEVYPGQPGLEPGRRA